jgi:hypothetical protein
MQRASVDLCSFAERMVPSPGEMLRLVYPKGGRVYEATLDRVALGELVGCVEQSVALQDVDLKVNLEAIGAILECSFLCCSSEMRADAPLEWMQTRR